MDAASCGEDDSKDCSCWTTGASSRLDEHKSQSSSEKQHRTRGDAERSETAAHRAAVGALQPRPKNRMNNIKAERIKISSERLPG